MSIITAIGIAISTLVPALTGGGSGAPPTPSPAVSDNRGLKEWMKKQFLNLGHILANLAGKAAAAVPDIIGSLMSWLLSTLAKTATWLAENLRLFLVRGLLFIAAREWVLTRHALTKAPLVQWRYNLWLWLFFRPRGSRLLPVVRCLLLWHAPWLELLLRPWTFRFNTYWRHDDGFGGRLWLGRYDLVDPRINTNLDTWSGNLYRCYNPEYFQSERQVARAMYRSIPKTKSSGVLLYWRTRW